MSLSPCKRRPVLGSLVTLLLLIGFATFVRLRRESYVVPDTAERASEYKTSPFRLAQEEAKRAPNVRPPPGEGDGTYRYVLGMNYWEQFTNAVKNFLGLACVAGQWRARLVRPFTAHSRLYGLPKPFLDEHFNGTDSGHDLSLILDPLSLDSVLVDADLRPLSSLEEMLRFGERRIVFLHFVHAVSSREYKIKTGKTRSFLANEFRRSSTVDCSKEQELMELARLVVSNLNSRLGDGNRDHFLPHKYVCINASGGLTPLELASQVGFHHGNASIVVVNWRGVGNGSAMIHSSKGVHPNKRVVLADKRCLDKRKRGKIYNMGFSQTVVEAAEKYMGDLGVREGEFVVVHFRSEKLVFRESRFPRLLSNCVNEALQKRDEIVGGNSGRGLKVLYFADIGEYGSETCKHCSSIARMKRLTEKYKFKLSHFSPSHYRLLPDRGLVAAVEMSMMSRAGHMILVGGGAFQAQLLQRFNSRRSSRGGVVMLCSSDKQARETTLRFSPPRH